MTKSNNKGFTLIEVTIVLLIVSIIIGYSVAMVPIQQEIKQYRQAKDEMDKIIESLYAFAQVNSYLPCPAWFVAGAPPITSNGFECRDINGAAAVCVDGANVADPAADSCDVWFGFVPGKTLGINGNYSATGLLLDPWGQPYRYQVTDNSAGGGAPAGVGPDFITQNEIRNEIIAAGGLSAGGLGALGANLEVCNTDQSPAAAGVEGTCLNSAQTVINGLPAVIMSTGKDKNGNVAATSWVQRENLDNSNADRVFVLTSRSNVANAEYDDIVKWISPNTLFSKMIEADQLP